MILLLASFEQRLAFARQLLRQLHHLQCLQQFHFSPSLHYYHLQLFEEPPLYVKQFDRVLFDKFKIILKFQLKK